uniref:GTP-binding protein 10 homolog n=1 Tax=Hirondellea gigas TaxID=1518452 RepID=A0A2P2I513_9CRUS
MKKVVKTIPRFRNYFIDTLRLYLKGGPGGAGHPKYGGLGGSGGNIYIEAKPGITLKSVQRNQTSQRYTADPGKPSQQFALIGKGGADLVLPVPPGVVATTDVGTELGESNKEGERVLVAHGGEGGSPTNGFLGQAGQQHHVKLVLKTIADIGLVGFPNAGKSTLLKAVSRAKPKIASYPFTTLRPKVGVIEYPDKRMISMADLPGLVEGAHENKGLGHSFLRHIERTKLLLLVVAVNGFKLNTKSVHRSAMESLLLLNKELELYDPMLLSKPAILLVNKMDLKGSSKLYDELLESVAKGQEYVSSLPEEMRPNKLIHLHEIVGISAKANEESVQHVKDRVRLVLDLIADMEDTQESGALVTYDDFNSDARVFQSAVTEHGTKLT